MATATENINLNLGGNALQQLQKLETQMGKISKSFLALRNVLAGLSFGAFVTNAYKFADAMDDTAKATNIATANVVGFTQAVQQNGGDLEGANNALNKFVENIGEAADGSLKMQETFAKVGVSLNDLRTLSEQDLLKKTLDGLSKIDDASLRAKLSVDLLSKGIKGVDVKGLAGDYDAATAAAERYAQSNKDAADAGDKLKAINTKVQEELLKFLQPINKLIKSIDQNSEMFVKVIDFLLGVAAAVAAFTVVGRAVSLIGGLITILRNLSKVPRFFGGFAEFFKSMFGAIFKGTEKFKKEMADVEKQLAKQLGKGTTEEDLSYLAKMQAAFLGIVAGAKAAGLAVGGFLGIKYGGPKEEDLQEVKIQSKKRETVRDIDTSELQKQLAAIKEITDAYQERNNKIIQGIQFETEYTKLSDDEVEIAKTRQEIYDNAVETIVKLQDKAIGASDAQKKAIYEEMAAVADSIALNQNRAEEAIKGLQATRVEQDKLNHSLEIYNMELANNEGIQKIQDEISLLGLVGDELEQAKIQLTAQQELRQKLIGYAEELNKIEADRVKMGDAAADREIKQIQDKIILAQQYYNESLANEQALAEKRKATEESSTYAIKQRMEEIRKQSTPAQVALGRFNAVFEGMSKSLDNFITTGKFKFKDFALSIIQDLIKIEAQRAASKLFSSIAGGVGGFLGKIFGFAEGGTPPTNKPSLVGEKGPELFVPRAAGTIIPNDQLGGSTRAMGGPINNTYITNNINALDAKSVAELFAQNRKTLLGSVKMAEREMPYAAR